MGVRVKKVYESYYGGKGASGVIHNIINAIRPHDVYMELFLGNGTVFIHKKPAKFNLLNDLNSKVCTDWIESGIAVGKDRLISNCNAIEFLKNYTFLENVRYCLYLDPPYPIMSRKCKREVYECEMTNEEHIELLALLQILPSNVDVLISTYKNRIYSKALKKWYLKTFNSKTRKDVAIEYLYMNYDPSEGILHEYTYLGVDNTDRQRIQRKIKRETDRLNRLPKAERNAIIQAVMAVGTM